MELTGKCKEEFEKWYIPYLRQQRSDYSIFNDNSLFRKFYRMHSSMQYGVYVDFFDSIEHEIDMWMEDDELFGISVGMINIEGLYTRLSARVKLIEEANEIYNNTN